MSTTVIEFIDPLQRILERERDVKEKAKKLLEKLHEQKRDLVKAKKFTCIKCNKESLFGTLGFVQEHRYEAPWGCTGGDTWHRLQKNVCNLICPHCASLNYIYNHPQKEKIMSYLERYNLQIDEIFAVVFTNHPTKRNSMDLTQVFPKE